MRVYTTSPLYNYVELVFRSRKLFIVSILMTTMAMASVVLLRPKSYSATSVILLYDESVNADNMAAQQERYSAIKNKVSLLSIYLKDHDFFQSAFEAASLDKDKTKVEVEKLIKDSQAAISMSVNDNILELSCRWPNAYCVNILNAVYAEYERAIITSGTKSKSALLTQMDSQLNLFTSMALKAEKEYREFEAKFTSGSNSNVAQAAGDLNAAQREVLALEENTQVVQGNLSAIREMLEKTPKTIEADVQVSYISPTETPAYQELALEKTRLEKRKNELLQTYTDKHPDVKKVQMALDEVQTKMQSYEGKNQQKTGNKVVSTRFNPLWNTLDQKRTEAQAELRTLAARLENARRRVSSASSKVPMSTEYRSKQMELASRRQMLVGMRDNLRTRREQTKVEYESAVEAIKNGVRLMVTPSAELETGGKKQMILLLAGPILGLVIAFAFSLLTETLDHSLRTPAEVERFLNKPVLAVLPNMRPAKKVTELVRIALKGEWRGDAPGNALPPPEPPKRRRPIA